LELSAVAETDLSTLRVVGIGKGDPFDRRTWSGASHHLFSALRDSGALSGVVDASVSPAVEAMAKAAAFHPRLRRWKERYEYSWVVRQVGSTVGARKVAAVDPRPDAVLQIGAYYDLSGFAGLQPRLRCSYHDANLALFTRNWNYVEDASARHIRAMMSAERRLLDRLDVVFAMSHWLRDSFIADFQQDPDKVVVVGAGVNNHHLPPAVDRDWEQISILFIGFEWERKGGRALIDAFQLLRADHPQAQLNMVGVKQPADVPDLPGVRWIGPVDRSKASGDQRMDQLHREATVFAIAPTYDPFPNAVLEAMAYGLPVVGIRRGSMPEVVRHGETGLLSDIGDAKEIARCLHLLFSDTSRAHRMGECGRERVRAFFTWDAVARRMLTAIAERMS
jgi:glycosyltransferase involved in cell wall biosynthesis